MTSELDPSIFRNVHSFLVICFKRSSIRGFAYLALQHLRLIEKLFWLFLFSLVLCVTVIRGLQSVHRYRTKNSIMSIERNYHSWNTTMASVTSCPLENRIDQTLFNEYCDRNSIAGQDKIKFYEFIESMANATYETFHLIKDHKSVEKLRIDPKDYMSLIYNLTKDLRNGDDWEAKVKSFRNQQHVRSEQVLTEHGICYTTNNYLLSDISANYSINGHHSKPLNIDSHGDAVDVITGNIFDGDKSYSFLGFNNYLVSYIHSPYDAMNIAKTKFGSERTIEFRTFSREIVTDENLQKDTSVSQRHCRFNSESNLVHYGIYTRGLCMQECRLNMVHELCGCIPHFYPNKIANPKPVCSYKMLKECVAPKQTIFLQLQFTKMDRLEQYQCGCMQNCVDSEVYVSENRIYIDKHELVSGLGAVMIVREYPIIRYKRKVIYSLTNFWVSIGATAAIATGVSVLGIFEMIYLLTLRMFWHLQGRKIQNADYQGLWRHK